MSELGKGIQDVAIGFAEYLLSGSIVKNTAGSIEDGAKNTVVHPPEFKLLLGNLRLDGEKLFADYLETLKQKEPRNE